LSVDNRSHNNT